MEVPSDDDDEERLWCFCCAFFYDEHKTHKQQQTMNDGCFLKGVYRKTWISYKVWVIRVKSVASNKIIIINQQQQRDSCNNNNTFFYNIYSFLCTPTMSPSNSEIAIDFGMITQDNVEQVRKAKTKWPKLDDIL